MTRINEAEARAEIVRVTQIVARYGLARSNDGNISVRLGDDRILVTPGGLYKLGLQPEEPLVVDRAGKVLDNPQGLKPTSELALHLTVYQERPDVQAVLHAHPPYATALTIAELPFPTDYLPEVLLALGPVPTAPYARPQTQALAESLRELIRAHDNVLLSHHGSVSVGQTLEQALISLERLEHAAYTYYLAQGLGTPVPLPAEALQALRGK
jgi:L-fuculose-phosphate aldolase